MEMEMNLYKNFPDTPGVYLFKDKKGKLLYIGKAGNLKRRVSSYFLRPHDYRIQKLVSEIKKIEYKKTDTAIEALILEAKLIKKYQPPYNIREKDDTSFLYVEIVNEMFPRVLLVRGKDKSKGKRFGPFTSSSQTREAL
ncbi:excinuclease ABC subunit C, partial [bacterium]